jgi:RNA polymerase sigma-70 factor (ECF subfamily)
MSEDDLDSRTSVTLLGRLRDTPDDAAAWEAFVRRYGPRIYDWSRRWGLQQADAEDVAQNVLLRLAPKLRTFSYDPARSFRGWLRTLTQHALSDFLEAQARSTKGSGDSGILSVLNTVAAREDMLARIDSEFDREILDAATARVRLRVEPQTWNAFRLTAIEGMKGQDAAEQLGIRVTAVFKAKTRVQALLQEEVARLEQGDSG